jgi:soluble lytic murein transglycosylase
MLLALAMTQAGDARTAHAIAKSLLEQPGFAETRTARDEREQLERLLFEVAYPQAFRPEIERWASSAKVPPDLLQGLMREESALDPDALSGAGAIGLCQLMPATGKRMARHLGLGDVTVQRLQEPELNIRLGAAYLGELLQRYGGRQPLAVAAYNAGEAAVDRWLAAAKGEPMDAFVEDIPIAETRNYVKRVLTSEAVYRALWGTGK